MQRWLDMRGWFGSLAIYKDPRVVGVLFLGFSSGLPIMLIASTLSTWLREEDVTRAAIGLFGFAFAPYTFKFAWAPLMDRLPLPPFTTIFGRRRGWMLASQIGLIISIFALGQTTPGIDLWWTAFFAVMIAFFSASQDIVIDAYRVEILPEEKLGAGAGVVVLGYRIAMWVATAGALLVAEAAGWSAAYTVMALLVLIGVGTVLSIGEPAQSSTALIDQQVLEEDRLLRQVPKGYLDPSRVWAGCCWPSSFSSAPGRRFPPCSVWCRLWPATGRWPRPWWPWAISPSPASASGSPGNSTGGSRGPSPWPRISPCSPSPGSC
jgi:MFS family permease